MSDLIKAHVGNRDFHPEEPTKVHWAKFNMMGKFIHLVMQYQLRSGSAEEGYSFEERPELREILNVPIMDSEVSTACQAVRAITYLYNEDATVADSCSRQRRIQ